MSCCDNTGLFPTADIAAMMSRNYRVIWAEINAIQQAILTAIHGCDLVNGQCVDVGGKRCTVIKGNTPMTFISSILSVAVTSGGSGYTTPTIVFTDVAGLGAIATVTLASSTIAGVTITNGGANYTSAVTVSATNGTGNLPPSLDAVLVPTVNQNTWGTSPNDYYKYVVNQSSDINIQDQVTSVISQFKSLGYDITAQVNPDTQSTIQWKVCW